MADLKAYVWRMVRDPQKSGPTAIRLFGRDALPFGTLRRDVLAADDRGMVYLIPEAIECSRSVDGESTLLPIKPVRACPDPVPDVVAGPS